jgi:hypothetical protein
MRKERSRYSENLTCGRSNPLCAVDVTGVARRGKRAQCSVRRPLQPVRIFPANCKNGRANGSQAACADPEKRLKLRKNSSLRELVRQLLWVKPHDFFELITGPHYNAAFN